MKFKKLSHALIFCLGLEVLIFLFSLICEFLVNKIFPEKTANSLYLIGGIERLILSAIGILIIKKLGKTSILKSRAKTFWNGICLGSPDLAIPGYSFLGFIIMAAFKNIQLHPVNVILEIIFMFITVGIFEEIYFRGIIIGVLNDHFGHKDAKSVWATIILSGILFGTFHLLNFFSGINPLSVLIQVISCTGIGIFFGTVYVRSRNLYSLIFLHAIHDILVMGRLLDANSSIIEIMSSTSKIPPAVSFTVVFMLSIGYVSMSIYTLRKEKMKEIINSNF